MYMYLCLLCSSLCPCTCIIMYFYSNWLGSPSIEFCGRRLHMNRSFRLILTTPTPPGAIPSYNSTHLVNMTPNLSLTQSQLLLQASQCVYDTAKHTETTGVVSDGLLTVDQLNTRLLQQLDRMGKGEAIAVTVDRIEQTMSDVNKVLHYTLSCTPLNAHAHCCQITSHYYVVHYVPYNRKCTCTYYYHYELKMIALETIL